MIDTVTNATAMDVSSGDARVLEGSGIVLGGEVVPNDAPKSVFGDEIAFGIDIKGGGGGTALIFRVQ